MFKIKVNITFRKKTLLFLNWKLDDESVSGSDYQKCLRFQGNTK